MCLYISKNYHPVIKTPSYGGNRFCSFKQKPILLKKPITVWKMLNVNEKNLISPYRDTPYQYGELKALMKDEIAMYFDLSGTRNNKVTTGLHAKIGERRHARENFGGWTNHTRCFPALIPVGSRVFIGDNNDIASTHMIVFRDVKSMLAHCGVDELAPPVKREDLTKYNKS